VLGRGVVAAGGQQCTDVLDHDDFGPQHPDGGGDLMPQPGSVSPAQASALPGCADVLAREARAEDVYRLYRFPSDFGDVAQVLNRRKLVREDRRRSRVVVSHPGELATEHSLNGHSQTLVAGAQTADPEHYRPPPGGSFTTPVICFPGR
jgi:hypothetical protein